MVEREIDRDSASKRQTNQRCVLHGEMLQEGVEISLGLERRVGGTRTAEPPGLVTDDTKVRCQNRQLLVPPSAIQIATGVEGKPGNAADHLVVKPPPRDRRKTLVRGSSRRGSLGTP